jgi:hypothetical protein
VSDRLRTALGTVGIASTLLGVLAVTTPGLVAGTEPLATLVRTLSDVEVSKLLLAGCVTVGIVVVRFAWRSAGSDRASRVDGDPAGEFDRLLDAPPEAVTVETARPTAADLDAAVDRAVAGDAAALAAVGDRLADLAADRLVRYRGYAPPGAADAVAAGTWTDDRVAAAFLSGDHGPIHSFGSRLRLWLDPEAERRRRLDRTVGAVDALDGRSAPPEGSQAVAPPGAAPPGSAPPGAAPSGPAAPSPQASAQPTGPPANQPSGPAANQQPGPSANQPPGAPSQPSTESRPDRGRGTGPADGRRGERR